MNNQVEKDIAGLDPTLDIDSVADFFGVSPWTVRDWVRKGRLRAYRLAPGRQGKIRVTKAAVGEFLSRLEIVPGIGVPTATDRDGNGRFVGEEKI